MKPPRDLNILNRNDWNDIDTIVQTRCDQHLQGVFHGPEDPMYWCIKVDKDGSVSDVICFRDNNPADNIFGHQDWENFKTGFLENDQHNDQNEREEDHGYEDDRERDENEDTSLDEDIFMDEDDENNNDENDDEGSLYNEDPLQNDDEYIEDETEPLLAYA